MRIVEGAPPGRQLCTWIHPFGPVAALIVALLGCTDLPIPPEPQTEVEITLDLPTQLVLGDTAWVHATVTDPEGNRIVEPPLQWSFGFNYGRAPLFKLTEDWERISVLGQLTGMDTVRATLGPHPFLVSDTASGSLRVGYDSVEVSFPGIDSVVHVASQGELLVQVRAVDSRGRVLRFFDGGFFTVQVEVRPGTALPGRLSLDGGLNDDYLGWWEFASGRDTVTVSFDHCLNPCENSFIVEVDLAPVSIGFPTAHSTFRLSSLGDSVRLSPALLDAAGYYIRDADPEYTFRNPADSLVLDPRALVEGILVARSNGDVRVRAQDGDVTGEALVTVRQQVRDFDVLDPVARYLVGPGAEDTTRIEFLDRRGNPVVPPPETGSWFHVQHLDVAEWEQLSPTAVIVRAVGMGEAWVYTSVDVNLLKDTVLVIPEPDSVRANAPLVNPVTVLGPVSDPLLGDIYLANESYLATELVWTALDTAVATVDRWGRVTALSNGTARFEGRMGASADTVTLTVSAPGG